MKFKITDRAVAEFALYRETTLDMIGHNVGVETTYDPNGYSALECWWAKDTHGKTLPCREPELLAKVIRSKLSVNLQIKLWAEDIADGMLLGQSELLEYVHGWPDWVFRATMEQAGKLATQTIGFAPRFARADYMLGNIWLPVMDRFDAGI
jgi:hypothetical protein